jgi:GT2 family glycosyltransferase
MKFAYIIVSYNSYSDICALLDSIEKQHRKPDFLIIVDNHSSNGDGEKIKNLAQIKNFVHIDAEKNGGFAYACNIGIQKAKELGSTHVWLINPDATLTDVDYLMKIENAFHNRDYEMIGTFVVNKDSQQIEFGWADIWKYTLYPSVRHRGKKYTLIRQIESVNETEYATGSSLFFSIALFDKVGIFDESYFMYFEETDYCMRARDHGYKIGIINNTYIDHATSSSVGRMSWFYVRYMIVNFVRFAWHHARWYQIPGFLMIYLGFWVPGFLFKYLVNKM